MENSRYLELFLSESREHISTINHLLLELEADASNPALVEDLFRAAHTLKGMAAAMGCARSADLAHALEHVLEQLRQGSLAADGEVTDALFDAVDALERAIQAEVHGQAGAEAASALERLGEVAGVGERDGGSGEGGAEDEERGGVELELDGPGRLIRVTVVVQASAPLPAVRAILALRRARELGPVGAPHPDEDRLNAGDFSGSLTFLLRTDREADEIRAALTGAGEIAHVLLEEPEDASAEPRAGDRSDPGARPRGAMIRISQDRLDGLVDQVGELVIARDRLRREARIRLDEELEATVEDLSRLIGQLRDDVMRVRMVPIGEVFERFPRLVRDAARTLGKRVDFTLRGRDVELDRSLLNELAELLVHVLRNAVDHGIESPEERLAAGKPETGQLRLTAARERSQVVVRVHDDGRGIQRERVVQTAVRRGLITADRVEALSDDEIFHLISRPGFSTAEQVTDVSGRGVGLDVVVTRLHALGGSLEVQTEAGRGTTFALRLPLSLAIVRCLQVRVGGESYLVPLASIHEVAEALDTDVLHEDGTERLPLREETVPLLRLTPLFSPGAAPQPTPVRPVVVVEGAEGKLGLVVDELEGHHESVVKPFDAVARMLPLFSGASLLADGRPALILDVPRIAAWAVAHPDAEVTSTTETLC